MAVSDSQGDDDAIAEDTDGEVGEERASRAGDRDGLDRRR